MMTNSFLWNVQSNPIMRDFEGQKTETQFMVLRQIIDLYFHDLKLHDFHKVSVIFIKHLKDRDIEYEMAKKIN